MEYRFFQGLAVCCRRARRVLSVLAFFCMLTGIQAQTPAERQAALEQPAVLLLGGVSDTIVQLETEWDFFWQRWIDPASAFSETAPFPDDRFKLNSWHLRGYPYIGHASYRLLVQASQLPVSLGLRFRGAYSAYSVYVNGVLIGQNGQVAKFAENEIGKANTHSFYFTLPEGSTRLELVIHASNHSYRLRAGILEAPWLGTQEVVERVQAKNYMIDILFAGSMLVMGVYHIFLTLFRKQDKAALFFGLFCLILAYRTMLITGEKSAFILLPWLEMKHFIFLQHFGIYPLVPAFVLYIHNLFREDSHKRLVLAYLLYSLVLFAAGLITAPFALIRFYNFAIIPGMLYSLYVLVRSLFKKRLDARLVGIGFVLLFALGVNDILNDIKLIDTFYMLSNGVFLFLFFQSIVLARRFSRAFRTVEDLSAELEIRNKELQELDKLKDDFLANTSHELKTPLNGIIGLTESVIDGSCGALLPDVRSNLQLVVGAGRRLYELVNDLLDFSRLREKCIHPEIIPVDVRSVCRLVLGLSAKTIPAGRDLVLSNELRDDTPGVLADPARLEQILFNLVGNAIKFTEHGRVCLHASWDATMVTIHVEDSGIGIPLDKQGLIFESFRQADSSIARRFGGSGLGLAIAKELLALQGGSISVKSQPGKGSVFSFSLPRAPERSKLSAGSNGVVRPNRLVGTRADLVHLVPAEASETASGQSGIPAKDFLGTGILQDGLQGQLLVVDDEYINLKVLVNNLTLHGYSVVTASGGREALRLIQESGKPDAVILDVMMPDMSGYELCRELRKSYSGSQLPIILLTARNQTADVVEGFDCGANDYLTKPFSRTELLARVKTHVDLAKINTAYGRFVPVEFLGLLNKKSIIDIRLGEQVQKKITVLFTDIRSFSSLSEVLTPEENFNFINSYLGRFGPIVRRNRGFVDKYVGDAIMAIFPGDPSDAIAAAAEMRHELVTYNQVRGKAGYRPIDFGIGIHSGPVIMGTVGETERMETTVISDIVNVAARLESLTKVLKSPVLAAGNCVPQDSPIPRRILGEVQVKGKKKTIAVVELLVEAESDSQKHKLESLDEFTQAVGLFMRRDFSAAVAAFRAVLERNPADKAASLYLHRCQQWLDQAELPEDWSCLNPEWGEY